MNTFDFEDDIRAKFIDVPQPPRPKQITLYRMGCFQRRFWRLFSQQQHRGKNYLEARRIAHAKLAPELRGLSEENRQRVLTSIELSE
tara:strand:- start:6664 stop:6924 length:261 start_codon:yes stop_codon:yes gene_type:complete